MSDYNVQDLVGQSYVFEDGGGKIEVIQIKVRDENQLFVTYHVTKGPSIPQKLVLPMMEFVDLYGHLFGLIKSEDNTEEKND